MSDTCLKIVNFPDQSSCACVLMFSWVTNLINGLNWFVDMLLTNTKPKIAELRNQLEISLAATPNPGFYDV